MEVKRYKIIFMGTPEFSGPGLISLISEATFEIVGVFTQPDKPVGREQILTPPAVKKIALEYNIPVFQPEKIKDELENIKKSKTGFDCRYRLRKNNSPKHLGYTDL